MNNSLNLCFSSSLLSLPRSLPMGVSDSINQTQITDVPALLNKVCVRVCCCVCVCVACVYVPTLLNKVCCVVLPRKTTLASYNDIMLPVCAQCGYVFDCIIFMFAAWLV